MAVLIEFISVVVRRDAIDQRFNGGWEGFVLRVPNYTLCTDGLLARVGFMNANDARMFVEDDLRAGGLEFIHSGKCADIVVIDELFGPSMPCDWIGFAGMSFDHAGTKVSAAWLVEGGVPSLKFELATPKKMKP